jgi:3-phenylpropionate/trans-cinnamate dioxygenase ferredoxin reductase subunit
MSRSIVVVGAGLAGLRAVEQLRGAGWSDPITVLGTENHLPYNRPPLTKAALQGGADPTALAFRRRPTTEDVEWRLGTTVTSADLDGHTVTLQDGTTVAYDGLVAASGVSSRRLDLAAPLHWRHAIRTVEDAHALHQQLRPDARLVVIGAGFIGC